MAPWQPRWLCAILFGCALVAALPVQAAMYKWTDANGRVVYSDQPPPGNVKSEIVGAPPPPANPSALKDMASQDGEFKKRQLDRTEAEKKAEKDKSLASRRQDLCLVVRGKIKELSGGQVGVFKYNDKGERVFLSEEERRKEIETNQELEKKYCAG